MTKKATPSDNIAAAAHKADVHPPALLAEVSDAILKLNIARKNRLIYPATHEQAGRSLQHACEALKQVIRQKSPLILKVMPDGIAMDDALLPTKSNALKEMASELRQRGIAATTFGAGVCEEELARFLELIIQESEEIKARGGIGTAAVEEGLRHIELHVVDYSRLHITEEREIQRPASGSQGETIWGKFVGQMLSGIRTPGGDGTEFAAAESGVSKMAALFNAGETDTRQAISLYEEMIGEYLANEHDSKAEPGVGAPASPVMDNFQRLIAELNPDLQQQFLSITFDQCTRHDSSTQLEGVIGGMEAELVVQMLRRANREGKPISRSLVAFVKKLGDLSESSATQGRPLSARNASGELQSLMVQEAYDDFVDEDYGRMLGRMSGSLALQDADTSFAAIKSEVEAELEEPETAARVALALKGLMDESIDLEEYRDWARQLTFYLDVLITCHDYRALSEIHDFITRQQRDAVSTDRQKICRLVLDHFDSGAFLSSAIGSALQPDGQVDARLISLLEHIGDTAVAEIVEAVGAGDPFEKGSLHFTLLAHFKPQAVAEALDRMRDARPVYLCRMLSIVRHFGTGQESERVKFLLDHEKEQVRMAALSTLLHFGNPWGILRLREMLNDQWSDTMHKAIDMAGRCKVGEAVPLLLGFVKRPGPMGPDIEGREAALRALGAIGDTQVLPELSKMVHRRWSLSRRHLNHLKRVLFESLDGYPYEAVKELVHVGLRQKDRHIYETCEQLVRKSRQGARPGETGQ